MKRSICILVIVIVCVILQSGCSYFKSPEGAILSYTLLNDAENQEFHRALIEWDSTVRSFQHVDDGSSLLLINNRNIVSYRITITNNDSLHKIDFYMGGSGDTYHHESGIEYSYCLDKKSGKGRIWQTNYFLPRLSEGYEYIPNLTTRDYGNCIPIGAVSFKGWVIYRVSRTIELEQESVEKKNL